MPRRPPMPPPDRPLDMPYPVLGLHVVSGYQQQPAETTPISLNVRGFEPVLERNRGGARSGLTKWIATQANGANAIQNLNYMAISQATVPRSVAVPATPSGYVLLATAIVNGKLRFAISGDPAPQWYAPTTDSTFWKTGTNIIRTAVMNQKLWVVDGNAWPANAYYWDPSVNPTTGGTVTQWVESTGNALPFTGAGGSTNNSPRLITRWHGRMVLAGLILDPNNWFMSAVGDPTNFNYAPASPTPAEAVEGQTATLGVLAEPITALIPYTDDVLVVGGQSSLWMIQGDPMAGGTIQLISSAIGVSFGESWTMDPYGNIYFISNRAGVYSLVPGQQPQRISQSIEPLLADIPIAQKSIRLLWNDRAQGFHLFVTTASGAAFDTHYFFDVRNNAWHQDQFGNVLLNAVQYGYGNLNPVASVLMEGYTTSDRVPLIGSWDGYVRSLIHTAKDDDGTPIVSQVLIGPILTKDMDDIMLKHLQSLLGQTSGNVSYAAYVGATAEIAANLAQSDLTNGTTVNAVARGAWVAGRNLTSLIRRSGHAIYVVLTAQNPWSFEGLRAFIQGEGRIRQRGR